MGWERTPAVAFPAWTQTVAVSLNQHSPHPAPPSRRAKPGSLVSQLVRAVPFPASSEPLHLTIVYDDGEDGWIVASIPEVPGVHSQGRTRGEARANVIDALHGILELRFGEHALTEPAADSDSLELVIAA